MAKNKAEEVDVKTATKVADTPEPKETPKAEVETPEPKIEEPKVEPTVEPKEEVKPEVKPDTPQIDPEKIKQEAVEEFEKRQETKAKEQEQRVENILKGWYNEYNTYAKAGKVPEIKNADDENDPGVVARRKLIQALGQMKQQGKDVTSLSQVLLLNPNALQAPGADAPVSGEGNPAGDPQTFKNSEIRNKSFAQIGQGN